jgi:uncharacterized protein
MKPEYQDILDLGQKNSPLYKKMFAHWRRHILKNLDARLSAAQDRGFEKVNCLDCGNCCRSLGPRLHNRDINRLAKTLCMKEKDFEQQYLRLDEENHMVFRTPTCPFIEADNQCFVYHDRPRACEQYPHLEERNQLGRGTLLLADAAVCPVVVLALEEMLPEYLAKLPKDE